MQKDCVETAINISPGSILSHMVRDDSFMRLIEAKRL